MKGKNTKTLVAEFQTIMKAEGSRQDKNVENQIRVVEKNLRKQGQENREDKREGDYIRLGKKMFCPYLQNNAVSAKEIDKYNESILEISEYLGDL